jgi:DMSO reductase anchor subunit
MCVDRLEVGLKPACVSACLGNALNFGVVENTPDNRQQIKTQLPGFPDPKITHPNIRFQQTSSMPREITRTDSAAVKYRRSEHSGRYTPTIDPKTGVKRHWNLSRLSSRENPLVLFTLATQASVGLFLTLFLGQWTGSSALAALANSAAQPLGLLLCLALVAGGLGMSALHLGKPMRFYRGFNNLRHSPMAREGLCAALFMAAVAMHLAATIALTPWATQRVPVLLAATGFWEISRHLSGAAATLSAAGTLYYMYRCYRIKARPFWDHWQSASTFVGAALYLGAGAAGLTGLALVAMGVLESTQWLPLVSMLMLVGVLIESTGLFFHARDMGRAESEGAVSHYVQRTTFGRTYLLRNMGLGVALGLLVVVIAIPSSGWQVGIWAATAIFCALLALVGRALFYTVVTPTTMPGAFFWKNKGFEEHARDIGLADMPQVGVAGSGH